MQVLYLDDDLLIMRSSMGIVHVVTRSSGQDSDAQKPTSQSASAGIEGSSKQQHPAKRKWDDGESELSSK